MRNAGCGGAGPRLARVLSPPGPVPANERYHDDVYSLPKPGYDPETMRAVALTYRRMW